METLVAMVILGICITIVVLTFGKLKSSQALDKDAELVSSVITEARSLTLAGSSASRYGVNIQDSQIVLFVGDSYATATPSNIITPLNSMVGIRNVSLNGGGTSLIFDRLTGSTSNFGTFEVYLRSATTSFKKISVGLTGIVEND